MAMAERWIAAIALGLAAALAPAQDPEFAATAPAKIPLPIEGLEAPLPTHQEATPQETPPPAPESATEADKEMAEIGAYMAEQDAAASQETSSEQPNPTEPGSSALASPAKSLGQGIIALCVTLVIILLIYAGARRWGKRTPLLAGQQLARVIGRVGLSPQASLHFVQTNGEVLVLGVTQQGISLLRTFDAQDFDVAVEQPVPPVPTPSGEVAAASFLTQLKESRASMSAEAVVDEDLDQLKGELQRLKKYFQDSTREHE